MSSKTITTMKAKPKAQHQKVRFGVARAQRVNYAPNQPAHIQVYSTSALGQTIYTSTTRPLVTVIVSDHNGGAVRALFGIYRGANRVALAWGSWTASGRRSAVTIPSGVLANGGAYNILAWAYDGHALSMPSNAGNPAGGRVYFTVDTTGAHLGDRTAPTAPTGLVAAEPSPTSVALGWNPSADAVGVTGYRIYAGATLKATVGATQVPQATITGLSPSTTYSFTVHAFDAAGNVSGPSNTVSVTMQANHATPTDVTPVSSTYDQVKLTWALEADASNLEQYKVYANGTLVADEDLDLTDRFATIKHLTPGTSYVFKVSAVHSGVESPQSEPLGVRTTSDTTAPAAPANPDVKKYTTTGTPDMKSPTRVVLKWTGAVDEAGNGSGIASYRVYRGSALVTDADGDDTDTTATVTGLTAGGNYSFTVKAVDLAGNVSPASDALPVTTLLGTDAVPPGTPAAPTATPGVNSVDLSWAAVADTGGGESGVAKYNVYVSGGGLTHVLLSTTVQANAPYLYAYLDTATTGDPVTATVVHLKGSTQYTFTVEAVDRTGNVSVESAGTVTNTTADTSVTTGPGGWAAVTAGTSVTLRWTPAVDDDGVITGYKLYKDGTLLPSQPTITPHTADDGTIDYYTATVTGLTKATLYDLMIEAVDASGNVKSDHVFVQTHSS